VTLDIAALQILPETEPVDLYAAEGRPGSAHKTRPHCSFISCIVTNT
jgi:hypothetical protein